MTITIYGYVPAWGLPDISPYVTKAIFYMKICKIPFSYQSQNLGHLDKDAPHGKLPYIIDDGATTTTTNGSTNGTTTINGDHQKSTKPTKVCDSNAIIAHLKRTYGDTLDSDLTPSERAISTAFDRLLCEHLYWSGVIEPRWRLDEGWEIYIPAIVQGAEVTPELREVLDAFRKRILAGFEGQGMGRRSHEAVLEVYKEDIDAVAAFLGEKKYFLGNKVRSVDAGAYAMLRHLVDQPQKWPGSGYLEGKKNVMAYLGRMREEFEI